MEEVTDEEIIEVTKEEFANEVRRASLCISKVALGIGI